MLVACLFGSVAHAAVDFAVLAAGPISPEKNDTVLVIFNAPVELQGAQNAANYLLNSSASFASASRHGEAQNLVYLTLKSGVKLTPGTNYFVRVNSVVDQQGRGLTTTSRDSNKFMFDTFQTATANILRCQMPDGGLVMGHATDTWQTGQSVWFVPYFAQWTLIGLLDAYALAPDPRYLEATRKFLSWYAAHMQNDGTVTDYTGTYPNYTSTGTYDSSDSYGAGHLTLAWAYYQASGDLDFITTLYPSLKKAVGAIELTLQSDGLTWAKPDYQVKYTMDNAEVVVGLEAAAKLAELMGDAANQVKWKAMAAKTLSAIHSYLYLGDTKNYYAIGMFANRSLAESWQVYYPDGMAQCFVINMALAPTDARALRIWNKTRQQFVPSYIPAKELDFQFAWSAVRMQDPILTDVGYVLMQRNSNHYSTDSGSLLRFMRLTRGKPQSFTRAWPYYR